MNVLGSFVTALKARTDDDGVDRLHYYYTCLILLLLSVTISAKQYVGQPIQCWVPPQFTAAWEQYAENYCFVQNTYWLAFSESIPSEMEVRKHQQIGYYQWVPFVLAIEASLFYFPCLMWRLLGWQTGIRLADLISMAPTSKVLRRSTRLETVAIISNHIQEALMIQRSFWRPSRALDWLHHPATFVKRKGFCITLLYLGIKLLYLCNVVAQFFLLNALLYPQHWFWGFTVLRDLSQGIEWEQSGHFPRVTMCDFDVRTVGNLHRYTIQCVLMINMFNEKVFLFLWWWYLMVTAVTVVNLLHWMLVSTLSTYLLAFVEKYLRIINVQYDQDRCKRFALNLLRRDGIFILRMLSIHLGDLVTAEVVRAMWTRGEQSSSCSTCDSDVTVTLGDRKSKSSDAKCSKNCNYAVAAGKD